MEHLKKMVGEVINISYIKNETENNLTHKI